jgi:putative oxidoreductase
MRSGTTSALHDIGLFLIRGIVGAVLLFHGSQKLFGWFEGQGMAAFVEAIEKMEVVPMPEVSAYLSTGTEFFGGLLLVVGFLTRLVAIPVAFNMFVAAIVVHGHAFALAQKGMEYPLTLAIVATALIFTGAGRISFDGALWRERSPPPSDGLSA